MNKLGKSDRPVEGLWGYSLEFIALLPPRPPARVLESQPIRDFVLLTGHVSPRPPDVLLLPVVGKVVNLATGHRREGIVVRY
jgi:hypothetical protein